MTKNDVLSSLEIWGVTYKILNKKERSEMFFPRVALLCHTKKFSEENNGKGFYLTGNNWEEIHSLFMKYREYAE